MTGDIMAPRSKRRWERVSRPGADVDVERDAATGDGRHRYNPLGLTKKVWRDGFPLGWEAQYATLRYCGPDGELVGKTALVRSTNDRDTVEAQFTDLGLGADLTHGWTEMERSDFEEVGDADDD